MPEHDPSKLPDGKYDADEIEQSIAVLDPDTQELIRSGIVRARAERQMGHEAMQFKSYIAEFAIALHIECQNDVPDFVNTINWSRLTWELSELVIRYAAKDLPVELPNSLKKAAAYTCAINKFARGDERDEVDELLIPFGYPTDKILDDLTDEDMREGRNKGCTREEVKEKLAADLEVAEFELWNRISRLESSMREDLTALGYQLPELLEDNSYGYSDEEGETFPQLTRDMFPA
jgi:hypothetical protein